VRAQCTAAAKAAVARAAEAMEAAAKVVGETEAAARAAA